MAESFLSQEEVDALLEGVTGESQKVTPDAAPTEGVRGYTITHARGKGGRGRRQSEWSQQGNVRIEIVCDPALAERVATRLRVGYYDHYAMILFMQDVDVLRPEKF